MFFFRSSRKATRAVPPPFSFFGVFSLSLSLSRPVSSLFFLPPPTPHFHFHSYVAHWREQLSDPDLKIVRPQEVYEGFWLRDVEPVAARQGPDPSLKGIDEFGKLPASNAYRRRVAGENWQ